jgi:small subunit ribosomal protein S8
MTDPIADMLTRIRNAQAVKKPEVVLPFSKIKFNIAKILEKEGYLGEVKKEKANYGQIRIALKYDEEGQPVIRSLKRISKPGRRIYATKDKLPRVLSGMGIAIISTSQGLMTDKEARKRKVGGEVICEVY